MSKPILKFKGNVKEGKLYFINREAFDRYLTSLQGLVYIIVKKQYSPRSNSQNAYYWGVIIEILAEHFGLTAKEMHEAIKWEFLKKPDAIIPTVGSTTDLTTMQFEDLMSKIRRWASIDYNCYIPLPNETEYDYSLAN